MQYRFTAPTRLIGEIDLPASKSISNRALILHALSKGMHALHNISDCDDTKVMVEALTLNNETIDIMAAGTAMRFLTAYLSTRNETHIITGTERMQQRPISILVDALRELGADIQYVKQEGYPPLHIHGKTLKGGVVTLKGNVSSQYISALLMIGPTLKEGLKLQLTGEIISKPYIEITLSLMKDFGAKVAWLNEHTIEVSAQSYAMRNDFYIENDWSAASYWYQMVALCPNATIQLKGLFQNSLQGDSHGARIMQQLGVISSFNDKGVEISKSDSITTYLDEDFKEIPDLAQTFVVTCALLNIPFKFKGLQTLRIKETDRISALINEMKKLGYVLHTEKDSILWWDGERCAVDENPIINTYEDHRMAMAFAPAVFKFPNLHINHPHVVTKSYPTYWSDLCKMGFEIIEKES